MDEEHFKAVFIATFVASQPLSRFLPDTREWGHLPTLGQSETLAREARHMAAVAEAEISWKFYAESRPAPEDDPEREIAWVKANLDGLHAALIEADYPTLLKVAELVGYEPMEPR